MPTLHRYLSTRRVRRGEWPGQALDVVLTGRLSYVVVFIVAFGLRLLVPLTSRGLVGNYSYDASVYYSAGALWFTGFAHGGW